MRLKVIQKKVQQRARKIFRTIRGHNNQSAELEPTLVPNTGLKSSKQDVQHRAQQIIKMRVGKGGTGIGKGGEPGCWGREGWGIAK